MIDPAAQDSRTMWDTDATPTISFRTHAIVHDVHALSEANVALLLLPGWTQYPEAQTLLAAAHAMEREVHEVSEQFLQEDN